MCYCGSDFKLADSLVEPLTSFMRPKLNLVGRMPYLSLQSMFDAATPKGARYYWKTAYLRELGEGAVKTLADRAGRMPLGLSIIDIHPTEGGVNHKLEDEMAFSNRAAPYVLNIIGTWEKPTEDSSGRQWVRDTWESLQPYSTGAQYLNFMSAEREEQVRAAYGPEKYKRLVDLKRKYDPANLFQLNQNIKP